MTNLVTNSKQYEIYQKASKDNLFAPIDKIQSRNTQYREEKVMNDITNTVDEVREKSYRYGE